MPSIFYTIKDKKILFSILISIIFFLTTTALSINPMQTQKASAYCGYEYEGAGGVVALMPGDGPDEGNMPDDPSWDNCDTWAKEMAARWNEDKGKDIYNECKEHHADWWCADYVGTLEDKAYEHFMCTCMQWADCPELPQMPEFPIPDAPDTDEPNPDNDYDPPMDCTTC